MKPIVLFLKSHIDTYTKGDGTVVEAHDDSRVEAIPHPSGKYLPGNQVFFPHPDPKKKGKSAIGRYMGQANGKSVIKHEQGGGQMYRVAHEHVKAARGIPKQADKWDDVRNSPEYKAAMKGRD